MINVNVLCLMAGETILPLFGIIQGARVPEVRSNPVKLTRHISGLIFVNSVSKTKCSGWAAFLFLEELVPPLNTVLLKEHQLADQARIETSLVWSWNTVCKKSEADLAWWVKVDIDITILYSQFECRPGSVIQKVIKLWSRFSVLNLGLLFSFVLTALVLTL